MRLLAALLLAFLGFASPALASGVIDPTVDNTFPSNARGARTTYVVSFATSPQGALGASDTITLQFPSGTGFGGWYGAEVRATGTGTTDIGYCNAPSGSTVTCQLDSGRTIAAGDTVTVTLNGVTNSGNVTDPQLGVRTSTDADLVSSPVYAAPAAGQLSQITVDNTAPSAAAGAKTVYRVRFTLSATGGLSGRANSEIDLTFPSLTGHEDWYGATVADVADGTGIGSCSFQGGGALRCWLYSNQSIDPGATVEVRARGITNSTEPGTDKTVGVDTTSDPTLLPSAPFTIAGPSAGVTDVSVSNAPPTAAAGARTRYVVGFDVSSAGALSADAGSELRVTFPEGTAFDGWTSPTVTVDGTTVGYCYSPSGLTSECYLSSSGPQISAGAHVTITFPGVTNPLTTGAKTLDVSTTSDLPEITSPTYAVVDAGTISGVTVDTDFPTQAAGGRTTYSVELALSATGALSGAANSRVYVTFPEGTTFDGWQSGVLDYDGADVGYCYTPVNRVSECYLSSSASVPAGATMSVEFPAVTNPPAGTGHTLSIRTTSDPAAVPSPPFETVVAGTISGVTATNASPTAAAGARTSVVVGFQASGTGALSGAANSRVYVTFPESTTFAGWSTGTVRYDGEPVGYCYTPVSRVSDCYISSSSGAVPDGGQVAITFSGVTNPPVGTGHRVKVRTTSDPAEIDSPTYSTVAAGTLTDVTVAAGSLEPSTTTGYEVRMTTSATGGLASAANSRLNVTFPTGTTFAGWQGGTVKAGAATVGYCYSPVGLLVECYVSGSSAVIPGGTPLTVTFPAVTNPAAGASGLTLTASTTSDLATVTSAPYNSGGPSPTPTPTPTPTAVVPTPEPTAIPAQTPAPTPTPPPGSVVAEPSRGSVQVCPPRRSCHDIAPGEPIPSGATVDTRKGAVELTAPDGGRATFSGGRFKLTRSGGYTELTLNEPLAACKKSARKAAAGAAAAKKPKTRKLWGEGKGKFRTKGRYSAATVRGTKWLVQDSCSGTLTRVTQGVVSVSDTVKRRTITLRAPKSYTARPRR